MTATGIGPVYDGIGHLVMTPEDLVPVLALPLFTALAALSTAVALIVLCVEMDENSVTSNHLWILAGMILVSFGMEFVYRRITGRKIHLFQEAVKGDTDTAQELFLVRFQTLGLAMNS